MCGLAGLFCYRGDRALPDETVGRSMTAALDHRGPDDGGLLMAPGVMLGHRRLSILDLSDSGRQPMGDESQQCWLVYNGEIYNFPELRRELEGCGRRFHSLTDTEVLLHGYLEWGPDVVHRLNGMFAFALWDRRSETLWLARDPIGIKPLFYHDDGRVLRFGSEIKAILADPAITPKPDGPGTDLFLTYGYTPAPWTGFEGIRQLAAGESLLVRRDESPQPRRWHRLPYPDGPGAWSGQESAERLGAAIDAAVRRQMVSDVPLGALLSGGLDSSAVVRGMARSRPEEIQTFTIGFDDPSHDESPYAAEVARLFNTKHHVRTVAADAADILLSVVSHAEEPFADNSAIPFYLLSESVRRGVTVALSGDGADELLAGYDTYRASQLAPWFRRIPAPIRHGVIRPLVRRLATSDRKYGWSMLLKRFIAGADLPFPRDHCSWRRYLSADLRTQLLTPEFLSNACEDPLAPYANALDDAPDWLTPLERQLHLDLRFHLPNDMLVKVDRMSMAHALEVRVPLLDLEIVETCLAIPPRHKRRGKHGKLVLKNLLSPELPRHLVQRRKSGFLVPLERWLRNEWQPLLRSVLTEEFAAQTGMFRWTALQRLLQDVSAGRFDHAYTVYALLVHGLWWKMWISRELPRRVNSPPAAVVKVIRLKDSEAAAS